MVLKLKEEKLVRGKKLRLDTYVIEANIRYPTDTSLLDDGIKVITRVGKERVSLTSAKLVEAKKKVLKLSREVVARGKGTCRGGW